MTEIRERMHLPVRSLSRWVDRAESNLRAMETGKRAIPEPLADWLERLDAWQKDNPPPGKSRRSGPSKVTMAPERMTEIRVGMYLPMRSLSRWVDRAEGSLRAMETDERPIPEGLADWLERLDAWQKDNPPPEKSR
jgi:outer membrane biogenesis lipoprotein LolB